MTEAEKLEIERLAGESHDATAVFNALRLQNVASDPSKAREQSIQFEVARAKMRETQFSLDSAIGKVGVISPAHGQGAQHDSGGR